MSFLCFDGETIVQTPEGPKAMKNLFIGDSISGSLVTSVYRVEGNNAVLYSLHGITVTGSHKVKYGDTFIRVEDHPDSSPSDKFVDTLVCFNTHDHRIRIGELEFLDFVETTEEGFLDFKNMYIQLMYNGKMTTKPYKENTGIFPNTRIPLADNRVSAIDDIHVGDVLDNGDTVLGIACHLASHVYNYVEIAKGVLATPSTWVFQNHRIDRADTVSQNHIHNHPQETKVVYQLITESSMYPVLGSENERIMILDELETTDDCYHSIKDTIIMSGSFRGKRIVV
jgi:hypothetical protein